MILADENIHSSIIATLRSAGFDVISVQEIAKGISDEDVIRLAIHNNWLLITQDKDFGEWVFAHHVTGLTVYFLRYSFGEANTIAQTIVRLIGNEEYDRPYFATISTAKIRIRKL